MQGTIVSYPERGTGGDNKWRGNCSPKLVTDLIKQYKLKSLNDFMCGSGTTGAAAQQAGIPCEMYDLHSGFDMLSMDIPVRSQNIFWHPPYWSIIHYSDNMYKAADIAQKFGIDSNAADLGKTQTWEDFVDEMNSCMLKQFRSLEKGGRMFTLVGDIKRKGTLYSMIFEMVKPGTLEQVIIKAQHNCWSDNRQYSSKNYVPITHEYLLVLKKDNGLYYPVMVTTNRHQDIRNAMKAPWRDVIAAIIEENGPRTLQELYNDVRGFKRVQTNNNMDEKVRQTLYINAIFQKQGDRWALAAA